MFLTRTPDRNKYVYTYKMAKSPTSKNNSLIYSSQDLKNNTTMADSFSRIKGLNKNLPSTRNQNSAEKERFMNSRGFDDASTRKVLSTTPRFYNTHRNSKINLKDNLRSLSLSLSYRTAKPNKIITNLQHFVDSSPSIKTVLVRRHILPKSKQNFTSRNISESRNKLHLRNRYPYDEYKIDRDQKKNLENGKYIIVLYFHHFYFNVSKDIGTFHK